MSRTQVQPVPDPTATPVPEETEKTQVNTETGEYFVYAHGGAYSSFGDSYGGQGCAGEKFILMSVEQAQQWSEEYLDADEYIAIWGEPEE